MTTFVFKVTTAKLKRDLNDEYKTIKYTALSAGELFDKLMRMRRLRWLWRIDVLRTCQARYVGYTTACMPTEERHHDSGHCRLLLLDWKALGVKRPGGGMTRLAEYVEEVAFRCWERAAALAQEGLVSPKEGGGE